MKNKKKIKNIKSKHERIYLLCEPISVLNLLKITTTTTTKTKTHAWNWVQNLIYVLHIVQHELFRSFYNKRAIADLSCIKDIFKKNKKLLYVIWCVLCILYKIKIKIKYTPTSPPRYWKPHKWRNWFDFLFLKMKKKKIWTDLKLWTRTLDSIDSFLIGEFIQVVTRLLNKVFFFSYSLLIWFFNIYEI